MDFVQPSKWKTLSENATARLTSAEKQASLHLKDVEKVKRLISETLSCSSHLNSIDNVRERLEYIVARTALLNIGVYELSERDGDVSAMLWAVLGLAIQCTAHDINRLEPVIKCYEDLLATVPALSGAAFNAVHSQTLREAIYGVYREHMDLGVRALKAFGRKTGPINIITKLKWRRELNGFYHSVRECKRRQQNAADELKSINVDEDNALREDMETIWRDLKAVFGGLKESPSHPSSIMSPNHDTWTLNNTAPHFPQFQCLPRSVNFVGQHQHLRALELKLETDVQVLEEKLRAVVVHGLGGIGKTHLVNEFTHKHRARYDACYWVTADTPIKLAQGFEDIARLLNIEETDHAQVRASVIDWLCKTERRWLLIFDNVEEPENLTDYFPMASSGSVLITSRSRQWIDHDYVHVLSLESISDEDGVAVLQSIMARHNRTMTTEMAVDIVHEVGGLPLAINQIGCYIATTHANAREFLVKYRELEGEAQRVHSYSLSGSKPQSQNLSTVWDITLSKLTPAATFILNCMVMLDPDEIPGDVFIDGIESGSFLPYISTAAEYEKSIISLDRWNLVDHAPSKGNKISLKVHRELRRRVLITAKPTDLQRALDWALTKLRQEFPHQSPFAEPLSRKWKQCGKWISHIISVKMIVTSFRSKLEVPNILTELLVDGAIYLWERGLLDQGYELIAFAEKTCSTASNCSKPLRAAVYSFRGCILSDRGKIDEAKECFKEEVNCRREHIRSLKKAGTRPTIVDEVQLANGYNNLAGILCACGSFSEAEINNELSIQIKEHWRKRGNLEYLLSLSYSNRANVLGLQQKWAEAASWYQKALDIPREKHYGPRLALIYHNFGTMRLHQGRFSDATKLLTEAVELRTQNLGHHYDTANSLHTLAVCYRKGGKLVEARDVLIEALKILESPHLRDRARMARSKYVLSLVLERLGDPGASALRQEAREIKAKLGSKSVTTERRICEENGEEDFDDLVPYV